MGGFRAPKLDKVRVAFVGVGERGSMHVAQMAVIEGAEVVGICDLYEDWAKRNADLVEKKTGKRPPIFTKGPEDYKRMMKEVKPDAVIVCPSWEWHCRVTCDVMKMAPTPSWKCRWPSPSRNSGKSWILPNRPGSIA